jgi:hypothetical protein
MNKFLLSFPAFEILNVLMIVTFLFTFVPGLYTATHILSWITILFLSFGATCLLGFLLIAKKKGMIFSNKNKIPFSKLRIFNVLLFSLFAYFYGWYYISVINIVNMGICYGSLEYFKRRLTSR